MSHRRALRVLLIRPADRQGLHPALRFQVPRAGGDVLPLDLLRLASAVKFGSPHRALVIDQRSRGAGSRPPGGMLRSLSRSLSPDVAVIWLHPALLADGFEAARQARHAGCTTVLGAGPLLRLWPEAAGRAVELDGLASGPSSLLAALEVLGSGGTSSQLAAALGAEGAGRWPVDRKLLDYAAYGGVMGPPWPRPSRPASARSDKGRYAASPAWLDAEIAEDLAACALLGVRFVDLLDPGAGDDPWLKALERVAPSGPRLRLQATPSRLRRCSLPDLRARGVESVALGPVRAGAEGEVEDLCGAAGAASAAGLAVGATAQVGVSGYGEEQERRGLQRLRSAGLHIEVCVPVQPAGRGWGDYADAPSSAFVPPGVRPALLEGITSPVSGSPRRVRDLVRRLLG